MLICFTFCVYLYTIFNLKYNIKQLDINYNTGKCKEIIIEAVYLYIT